MNNRLKKGLTVTGAVLGAAFAVMSYIARKQRVNDKFKNDSSEQNPMYKKKVIFVEDENDPMNADGKCGHLEAVGERDYTPTFYEKYVKRGIDVILAFAGMVVLAPVYAVTAIAIKIDSPGPVIFKQKRIAQQTGYFTLPKFRSMAKASDVPTHMLNESGRQSNITAVGKVIRRLSIDELPQLWSIFKSDMSIIGPRPALWNQDYLTAERDKYGANDIKPGLTGLAQAHGRDELEIPDKAKLDGEYAAALKKSSWSGLKMDIKVFVDSVKAVLKSDGVVEGGTGEIHKQENKTDSIERFFKGYQVTVDNISGKRILFFSPAFFSYENMIADKMREMGAEVDMYDVRSVTSAFDRALLKISPAIFNRKSQKYYENIIEKNRYKDYDYILIVKCDMTPVNVLSKFKVVFPNAKLCLNLWDSVENIPGVTEKFQYFDTLHSFDLNDCEKYPVLKFRPLFFADQFRKKMNEAEDYNYDISFIGTVHSDRYAVIRQMQEIAEKMGLKSYWFLYLQGKFIYQYYKITKKEFRRASENTFSFDKMSTDEIAKVVDESQIIFDIQHPKQTGLTMRTIEMIGMNKKIITTNESIKKYDFYNENNIAVVDRRNVKISDNFWKSSYKPLPEDIYEKYSLKSWILEVLS